VFSRFKHYKKYRLYITLPVLLILGCSKGVDREVRDDNFYFERGLKYLEKKQYENAIQDFQTVVDTGTSAIVDHAQFMLGETHYRNEDYLTAAFEYTRVYMDFPSSNFAAEAWYKKAMCYFMESPKANLDQENTLLAIDEFNRFIGNFPRHDLVEDARKKISELEEKLSFKEYSNGEQYRKMKEYDAALIYYESVIEGFPNTVWADYCRYSMGLVHIKLLEREIKKIKRFKEKNDTEKYEEASETAQKERKLAKDMLTLVLNSDTDTDLQKKASQKLSELEKLEDIN